MSSERNVSDLDRLRAAARDVDVLDQAGRIIANPVRHHASSAGELALAWAVEAFWSVALEAEQLVGTIERMAAAPAGERPALMERAIDHCEAITRQMAAVRGETNTHKQETDDGES